MTTRVLELLHVDLMGLVHVKASEEISMFLCVSMTIRDTAGMSLS